jgi:hypothetical protein
MKKLYVSQSLIDVESRKELLDQAEIACTINDRPCWEGKFHSWKFFQNSGCFEIEILKRRRPYSRTGKRPNLGRRLHGPARIVVKCIKKNLPPAGNVTEKEPKGLLEKYDRRI